MISPGTTVPGGASLAPWWLLWVLFVIYGSLVPLEFRALPFDEALARFRQLPMLQIGIQGRADWVANGVLYLPIGFLAASVLAGPGGRRGRRVLAFVGAVVLGLALAVAVEFSQLYFPQRTVSLNDLIAEGVGTVVGAALAWRGAGRSRELLLALQGRWHDWPARLLRVYALGLFVLSLFPYDLLISATELAGKAESRLWGLWLAPTMAEESFVRIAARLCAEGLVIVPMGWLWARQFVLRRPAASAGASLATAAALGALYGLALEVAQWFIASGVSQGVSVLTRAAGFALGAWLWSRSRAWQSGSLRSVLNRHVVMLALAHAVVVLLLSGWFSGPWRDLASAIARVVDGEVRFVPFYYHYYTTEAVALFSLMTVTLLYAPLGVLAWARGWLPGRAALLGGAVSLVVEAGKLFPEATRPDPTNVLIAASAAGMTAVLLRLFTRPARPLPVVEGAAPTHGAVHTTEAHEPAAAAGLRSAHVVLAAVLALTAVWLVDFPLRPLAVGAAIVCGGVLVWWQPVAVFALAAGALPLFDLAPWSGRVYIDEYDLLLLVGLAVALARTTPAPSTVFGDRARLFALGLVMLSVVASTLQALRPWDALSLDDAGSPLGSWHALRLAKGALWAFALYGLARRLEATGIDVGRAFGAGMVTGLAGVVAVVVWERAAFVGLWDTAASYRVAGPLSAMQIGGAYIEAYIVAAMPLAVAMLWRGPNRAARVIAALVLAGAAYALAVTFSRAGYVAGALALALSVVGVLRQARSRVRMAAALVAAVAMLAIAIPFVTGPFGMARLSSVERDLGVRSAHWSDTLALRDQGWIAWAIGNGMARFPATLYWNSAPEERTGVHGFVRRGAEGQLRLGPGPGLYVDQVLPVRAGERLRLEVEARSADASGRLHVSLCHKWLLSSADCVVHGFDVVPSEIGAPRSVAVIETGVLGGDTGLARRPVRLSLHNAGATRIDVDRVALIAPDGSDLVLNGRFAFGSDHWTYTADDHLAWHAKNMALGVLFDQGLTGVAAMAALLALALLRSGRAAWAGSLQATALFAALCGLLVVGAFDTLTDTPRFLLLLLTLGWLGASPWGARRPALRST